MKAVHKLSYGLFLLTAASDEKDNGCIINTAMQMTSNPLQVSVCVNKENLTHDMIKATGEFNVSILSEQTPFSVFQNFGMQTGKEIDKFADFSKVARSENGLYYLTDYANAFISVKVNKMVDVGTHTEFIGDVTEDKVLSDIPSATYQYYFDNIKPKPEKKKRGFVCRICGYVYEGDELPSDFICPICKHGADAFDPL